MAQNNTPVKALVLAGGGARGSYQPDFSHV